VWGYGRMATSRAGMSSCLVDAALVWYFCRSELRLRIPRLDAVEMWWYHDTVAWKLVARRAGQRGMSPANGAPAGTAQAYRRHCAPTPASPHRLNQTVTDEFTKEGLAIDVDGRIRSARVIGVLSRLVSARGTPPPGFLRSDNGPEFVSKALPSWVLVQGIGTAVIEPGKPWQNGVAESFNGKFRDECLSIEWFRSRLEAKVLIEKRRSRYNKVRPHSSLGYLTPNEFVA
jgi:putative transposase